jgi:DNA-binding IclR family transcriptional regulator
VFDENNEIMGAISLSYPTQSPPPVTEAQLIKFAKKAAKDITLRVAELSDGKKDLDAAE